METVTKSSPELRRSPLAHNPEAVTWARESVGYTKTRLAQEIGISLGLMSDIEHGRRNATPATLNKLARALNCPRSILERKREVQA